MPTKPDFTQVFSQLTKILKKYESRLVLQHDKPDNYYLNTHYSEKWKKELFFGAVMVKKNYVSFYLMPVYMFPELLADISPELRRRMQGKSCFNFKSVNKDLFAELAQLTARSFERFKSEGLI